MLQSGIKCMYKFYQASEGYTIKTEVSININNKTVFGDKT